MNKFVVTVTGSVDKIQLIKLLRTAEGDIGLRDAKHTVEASMRDAAQDLPINAAKVVVTETQLGRLLVARWLDANHGPRQGGFWRWPEHMHLEDIEPLKPLTSFDLTDIVQG